MHIGIGEESSLATHKNGAETFGPLQFQVQKPPVGPLNNEGVPGLQKSPSVFGVGAGRLIKYLLG